MDAVWAVVLAAGASRRFEGAKLLAPLWGRPLVSQTLEAVTIARRSGHVAGMVVVVPSGDNRLITTAASCGALIVENPETTLGLSSSLQLGLSRLEDPTLDPPAGAALIVLGDQPLLRPEVVETLVQTWRSGAAVVRPVYRQAPAVPGHPVLVDRGTWHVVSTMTGDRGLGPVFARHPEWVQTVMVEGDNPDIDTPDDLRRLEDDR